MFIEPIAIMVMTLPVMFPIMVGTGFDPIWLGVISIKLAEISLITPPVGLNVYVVKSASPIPLALEDVFMGILPFLVMDFLTLALLIAFPQITLVLPLSDIRDYHNKCIRILDTQEYFFDGSKVPFTPARILE
jgi:TRAP-type C4-dicarboxylate transport system permease large subunit